MTCWVVNFFKIRTCIVVFLTIGAGLLGVEAFSGKTALDSLKHELLAHPQPDTHRVRLLNALSAQFFSIDYRQVIHYSGQALKLAEKLAYPEGIAKARNGLAHAYLLVDQYELALKHALRAEAMAEQHHLPALSAESCRIIGSVYMYQGDLVRAGQYHEKAIRLVSQTADQVLLGRIYVGLGTIQILQHKDQDALVFYQKSLSLLKEARADFYLPMAFSSMGGLYGRSVYRNPAQELRHYQEGLFYARKSGNRFAEGNILANLGSAYIARNQYREAENYLRQALQLSRKTGMRGITNGVYANLVDLYRKQGNYRDVERYMQHYYDLRDSLLNEKRTRQIVALETQYQTEKREQTIKLLEQEKRFHIASKNFWISGSILLFAAVIIIYYLQQSRTRKARELLDVQQTLIEKLKETDGLKSRFFANISHEFRTPLSLILAPLEEMLSSKPSPGNQTNLNLVKRNANRLLDLVNQLLDLSKLEAGKMSLHLQQDNLQHWLQILVASFDSLAEAKKVQFLKRIAAPSESAWFDRDKLEKIITNILSNAFKFTGPGGSVALSVQTNEGRSELFITLTDTGKGIPEADLPHIFSPFYQSRQVADDGQPGTGLGLALVHELVKLHRGEIDVESQVDTGTTISILLPISREKLDFGEAVFAETPTIGLRKTVFNEPEPELVGEENTALDCLLVVEDNPDLRNFIASIFQNQFRVVMAADGEEGLQLATEILPDLIISDVMMPRLDGIGLTEAIRANDLTSHIPVLLLTAKSDVESRMDGFRTGADDYLSKPFSTEELRVRVSSLIELRKKLAAKYRSELLAPPSPATRILSLDDKFILQLRAVVETHLSNSAFGVEQLADEMCLSRTQLFRKVKALLETSPIELINDIRLQRAAELIRSRADSLTQISYSVGFSEQSYFAKRFRKKFGVSPSEYANS